MQWLSMERCGFFFSCLNRGTTNAQAVVDEKEVGTTPRQVGMNDDEYFSTALPDSTRLCCLPLRAPRQ